MKHNSTMIATPHLYRLLSLHLPVYIYDCISPIYIGRYPPQHPQFAANLIETLINPYFIICAIVNFSVEIVIIDNFMF